MAAFSDYFENKILNLMFGGVAFTAPATYYLVAYTAAPSDTGGGTEVGGAGYARVALTNNTTVFGAAGTTSERNLASSVEFPEALSNWGTVTAIGISDNATLGAGNLIAWTTITSQIINSGDVLRVPAGTDGLSITLD